MGYWGNQNGHAVLDKNGDGRMDSAVVIGSGTAGVTSGRSANVTTIALSDKIEGPKACDAGQPSIWTCSGTRSGQGLSGDLQLGTLNTLAGQTLALTYNIRLTQGYSGQTVNALGCASYLAGSLSSAPVGLSGSSTVNQVLTAANKLIANSAAGGSTRQAQAGPMNSLLGCLNRETLVLVVPVTSLAWVASDDGTALARNIDPIEEGGSDTTTDLDRLADLVRIAWSDLWGSLQN
jgi:hypothetical protein